MKCGSQLEVAVPDKPTGACLRQDFGHIIGAALWDLGVEEVRFIIRDPLDVE
jgi:hypothetical protein